MSRFDYVAAYIREHRLTPEAAMGLHERNRVLAFMFVRGLLTIEQAFEASAAAVEAAKDGRGVSSVRGAA